MANLHLPMVRRLPPLSHTSFDFEKDIVPEVLDYFDAWHETIGFDNWDKSSVNNCLFKSKTQARIMLKRFPQIYDDTPANYQNEETKMWRRTKKDFLKTLEPLKNIPFTDDLLLKTYKENALPEESWQILDSWIHDALTSDKVFSKEEIMDTKNQGVAGAGIISEPPDLDAKLVKYDLNKGLDPTDGKDKQITLNRPKNCFLNVKCKYIEILSN